MYALGRAFDFGGSARVTSTCFIENAAVIDEPPGDCLEDALSLLLFADVLDQLNHLGLAGLEGHACASATARPGVDVEADDDF